MNWNSYMEMFDDILEKRYTSAPYDNEAYLQYVQMNHSRMQRWLKKNPITDEIKSLIEAIETPQKWILITEPWCGDAAHSTPIIELLADLNPNISLEIVLRDSSDLIDSYLTNGGKSIPILIARDAADKDLFVWGPRPIEAQSIVLAMKGTDISFEEKNKQIQQWYNKDRSLSIQNELVTLLKL